MEAPKSSFAANKT